MAGKFSWSVVISIAGYVLTILTIGLYMQYWMFQTVDPINGITDAAMWSGPWIEAFNSNATENAAASAMFWDAGAAYMAFLVFAIREAWRLRSIPIVLLVLFSVPLGVGIALPAVLVVRLLAGADSEFKRV